MLNLANRLIRTKPFLLINKNRSQGFLVKGKRWFGDGKENKQSKEKGDNNRDRREGSQNVEQQAKFNEQQTKLIKEHEINPLFNKILNLADDYNPQKEIIVQRKQFQNSTKELRSAILFQDLLKTEINILLYHTKGKPYFWEVLNLFYKLLSIAAVFYGLKMLIDSQPKYQILLDKTTYGKVYKFLLGFISICLFISAFRAYIGFVLKYVESIHYDTKKQELTMIKRTFFGTRKPYVMNRYKLLYTENKFLNKKKINYFDIQTKQSFMIIYKQAWIKQDLFSHLISQRINL